MPGETGLDKLLAGLQPSLDKTEYAFATLPAGHFPPPGIDPVGTFREAEGMTIIAPASAFDGSGLQHTPGWARITLEVHSALTAVGLTAAVSKALADAGISANIVAAYHHDHVFVPWHRREEAMSILLGLSQAG